MTTYRVATGHDVVLGSLTVLSPQPRSAGLQYARRTPMADGTIVTEGPYVELVYDMLESATAYQSLMTTFGINSATSAAVTVYVRSDQFAWVRMNGRVIRPVASWQQYFPRNFTILIRDLETAS